jgi:hypothetical protein
MYADRKITNVVLGQLVEVGSIDATVTVEGNTDSSQMRLVLDDTDGAIKALCDQHDLHKRPVWVYQWFEGLSLSDKFLLFKGEINSPFTWNEGDRTVSFDVTARIEDVEAGFSMEEGDFPVVPPDALGKAWPLVFGSVCDVKAVQVRAPRFGILQTGEGIHDYTLESRICQARYIQCPNVPLGETQAVTPESTVIPGVEGSEDEQMVWTFDVTKEQNWGPDQSCVEDRYFIICDLIYQLEQQQAYEHPILTIQGASTLFPQGERLVLNIEGGKFTGTFSGDVFTIVGREHPDYAVNSPGTCRLIDDRSFQVKATRGGCAWTATEAGTAWYEESTLTANPQEIADYCNAEIQRCQKLQTVGGPVESRKAYDDMPTASFFWARAGSKVFLESEAEVLFIVNLLPCTITRVAAMKQTAFGLKLMTVPAAYYTIYETDYDGYTVTEIGMAKPLSQRSEVVTNPDGTKHVEPSKWSDDLYVTVTSSVGPNPVDIITWLIGKYTSLSIDSASFAHVRTMLTKYPANFALLARKNVMELIADIAVQSRCVVYVRNDVVYLKYFSEEPDSLATIAVGDVLVNTLRVSLSSTDELATKHVVTWKRSESEGDLKIVLKHNVAKYGTREKTHDYYTLNIFDNVLKSATFWAIRDANAWKIVEFSTPLKHLALEVFDCVTLDLPGVASTKAVITAAKYDVGNQQIDFTCWTPIRAGEMAPYIHAWPALIPAGTIFPTAEERTAGLGYNFTVAPPEGHLLYAVAPDDGQPKLVLTAGDSHPSDLDDVLETCFCPTTDDAYVEERDPVFEALKKAEKANRDAMQSKMDAGAGGKKDQDKKPRKICGESVYNGGCLYEVTVGYLTVLTTNKGCSGKCGDGFSTCGAGCTGLVCTSNYTSWCHTFTDLFSALKFAYHMREAVQQHIYKCPFGSVIWGHYLETFPSIVSGPVAHPDSDPKAAPCETVPGDQMKPNKGENYRVSRPTLM